MATRSTIAMLLPNGTVQSIYCHWDGYLEGVGLTLANHYTRRKTKQLLANGDVSSLGKFVGHKHGFYIANKVKSTTFYGRDRGEEGTESINHASIAEWISSRNGSEFFYLLQGNEWWYLSYDITELEPVLMGLLRKED